MNPNYETVKELAQAIYSGLISKLIMFEIPSRFYEKLEIRGNSSAKAYSIIPYDQVPEYIKDKLYDLALITINQAEELVCQKAKQQEKE